MNSLDALFSDIDDFCQNFEPQWHSHLIEGGHKTRCRAQSLCLSEIMTILVAFHQHHYRNFKPYYLDHVCVYWSDAFPGLPSSGRFVEWIPQTLLPLCVDLKFLQTKAMSLNHWQHSYLKLKELNFLQNLGETLKIN
jgi:hypothetical protein